MPLLHFQAQSYECTGNETVLESLTKQGVPIPSSCRSGVCQTCLMRAVSGAAPVAAQAGLKPTLAVQGYFLACLCKPQQDMEIALAGEDVAPRTPATVVAKQRLNADTLRLSLRCHHPFDYYAGQFAHLVRPDGLVRSYSLASPPDKAGGIEFHVRHLHDGAMSNWIHEALQPGDTVEVAGPYGNCFYTPGAAERNLLLIGTGSGLAPLFGIVTDALRQNHFGAIHLYHGSRKPGGLYLVDELRRLAAAHSNFHYVPCVSAEAQEGFRCGRAAEVALTDSKELKGSIVYLCGHPEMVKVTKKRVFLAGVSMRDIYADPFVLSPSA